VHAFVSQVNLNPITTETHGVRSQVPVPYRFTPPGNSIISPYIHISKAVNAHDYRGNAARWCLHASLRKKHIRVSRCVRWIISLNFGRIQLLHAMSLKSDSASLLKGHPHESTPPPDQAGDGHMRRLLSGLTLGKQAFASVFVVDRRSAQGGSTSDCHATIMFLPCVAQKLAISGIKGQRLADSSAIKLPKASSK